MHNPVTTAKDHSIIYNERDTLLNIAKMFKGITSKHEHISPMMPNAIIDNDIGKRAEKDNSELISGLDTSDFVYAPRAMVNNKGNVKFISFDIVKNR